MINHLKKIIKKTPLFYFFKLYWRVQDYFRKKNEKINPGASSGLCKYKIVKKYAEKYNLDTLIETETPITEELAQIFNNFKTGNIILIDDARLFVGKRDYPRIEEIKKMILSRNMKIKIEEDVIIIY